MKLIAPAAIAVGVLAIILLAVSGQQEANIGGELAFASESVDLGRVPLDTPAPFRFEMRNVGDKAVKILDRPQISAVEGC